MQQQRRLLAVLAGFAAIAIGGATRLSSLSAAQSWLRVHSAPQQDELDELKGVNPEAYAIVKALLTKRSLGLLNSKHPSASFAPVASTNSDPTPQGTTAFALSDADRAAVAAKTVAPEADTEVYPDAPVVSHQHHDFFNWKPSGSGDDETMVNNVLGEVATLAAPKKASNLLSTRRETGSALSADEDFVGGKLGVDVAAVEAHVDEKPVAAKVVQEPLDAPATGEGNRYLSNINFGLKHTTPPRAAAVQENSYLRGLDLTTDGSSAKPAAAAATAVANGPVPAGGSYLSDFSWGADQPHQEQQAPPKAAPEATQTQPKKQLSALSSWLGVAPKSPVGNQLEDFAAPPTEAPAPANTYASMW